MSTFFTYIAKLGLLKYLVVSERKIEEEKILTIFCLGGGSGSSLGNDGGNLVVHRGGQYYGASIVLENFVLIFEGWGNSVLGGRFLFETLWVYLVALP